jgi:hypothetical protein
MPKVKVKFLKMYLFKLAFLLNRCAKNDLHSQHIPVKSSVGANHTIWYFINLQLFNLKMVWACLCRQKS